MVFELEQPGDAEESVELNEDVVGTRGVAEGDSQTLKETRKIEFEKVDDVDFSVSRNGFDVVGEDGSDAADQPGEEGRVEGGTKPVAGDSTWVDPWRIFGTELPGLFNDFFSEEEEHLLEVVDHLVYESGFDAHGQDVGLNEAKGSFFDHRRVLGGHQTLEQSLEEQFPEGSWSSLDRHFRSQTAEEGHEIVEDTRTFQSQHHLKEGI